MMYYVELSEEETEVALPCKLFPVYAVDHEDSDWVHAGDDPMDIFMGCDCTQHPIVLWEDETGYVVDL